MTKGLQNDHILSLRAIGHDSVWMAKGCRMTIICLRMSSGPLPLDDKRVQNDHNLSLCAIGHDCVWMAKGCGMTIICLPMSHDLRVSMTEIVGWPTKARLLLLRILNLWWGTQTYVVLDSYETNVVSVFSSLKYEHALVNRQNFQRIRATYAFFYEKWCVYRGTRVCWRNFLITINEILDVSISFLNNHLEETLGPTK